MIIKLMEFWDKQRNYCFIGGHSMETLICKGKNDECRIYQTECGFELRYNSIFWGDPCYIYNTLKGAKIAMARMAKGIYKGLKPSTAWE